MSECDLEASTTKRSWPTRRWCATERNTVSQTHQSKRDVGAYSLNNSQLRYLFVKKNIQIKGLQLIQIKSGYK